MESRHKVPQRNATRNNHRTQIDERRVSLYLVGAGAVCEARASRGQRHTARWRPSEARRPAEVTTGTRLEVGT